MSDNLRIDSHKLIYHPDVVAKWMKGDNIYPIELEVGLTNSCNHRCIFCAYEYIGYKPVKIKTDIFLDNINQMSKKGLKSVVFAGEGEPLLHPDAPDIINKTKNMGVDTAMSTNAVFLTPEVSKDCLKSLTWVRFSTAAISNSTYEAIHQCREGDLEKVLFNMEEAVRIKRDQKLKTTLGVQLLLLPQNKDEVVAMGKKVREIGVDYFTIKPFSHHPQSQNDFEVDYNEMLEIEAEIKSLETKEYKIYFRAHSMKKLACTRDYKHCWALPFMVYMDAKGNIWPCSVFIGNEKCCYGNIYDNSFENIWEGENRRNVNEMFYNMDLSKNCRELCRLDEMNKYLDQLMNPHDHVNFI